MTSDEKAEMLKTTIHHLYSEEGRSKSYISRLLDINRKTVSDKIKEWELPEAKPAHHLTPSNQKFLNKNKNLIKSRLDNDVPLIRIAEELKISRHSLTRTFIANDEVLTKAFEDHNNRKQNTAEKRIEERKENSGRDYSDDLPNEIWKPILGYTGYEVSNMGRIRHYAERNKAYYIVKSFQNKNNGYQYVMLYGKDRKKNMAVARIVAHTFVPGDSILCHTVNHKNGNKNDNRAENLEWISQSENNKHAYEELGRTKVMKKKYHFDRILYQNKYEFKTVTAFAKFLGKSETQVRRYLDEPKKHEIRFIKDRND